MATTKNFQIKNVINRSQTMKLNASLPEGVRFSKVRSQYIVTDRSGAKHEVGHFYSFDVDAEGIVHNVVKYV